MALSSWPSLDAFPFPSSSTTRMTSLEQTALYSKMAFVSDGQDYSSPTKRIKLDESTSELDSNAEIEFRTFATPLKTIKGQMEGK